MANKLYEKVEEICQRIDLYTEKEISVKNEVKSTIYTAKIKELISMIEIAENNPNIPTTSPKEEVNEESNSDDASEDKYNPYSENFYYKDKLKQLDGDINKLIEELKAEDEIGYRNAYIISEIEKNINTKKESVKDANISKHNKKNKTLTIKDKVSLWERIKRIFR